MSPTVPLFKAGVACWLPTCAQGSSVPVMVNAGTGFFLGFLVSSWCLVHMGSSGLSRYKTWVFLVCL